MLTSPDIVPKILDCLDWPSKGRAACVCRQWWLSAISAEASLSADKCWLTWQQFWPPEGPVLRHVQKCKVTLRMDEIEDFSWPHLPLTAVHIETRLMRTRNSDSLIIWDDPTVRGLSVTVLCTNEHCLTHGDHTDHQTFRLCVADSCLETLSLRVIVAETGLLACGTLSPLRLIHPVGLDLSLASFTRLWVCGHEVKVSSGQEAASQDDSLLRAAILTDAVDVDLTSGDFDWASDSDCSLSC